MADICSLIAHAMMFWSWCVGDHVVVKAVELCPPGLWRLYSDQCWCPDWWCAWTVWALWRSAGWRRKVWFFFSSYVNTRCNYVHNTRDFNLINDFTNIFHSNNMHSITDTTSLKAAQKPRPAPSSWGAAQSSSWKRRSAHCTMLSWLCAERSRWGKL